ncbi:hypothetical protein FF011L_48940 [Roseimaritima multifibrata]|uniref:Uncharacterized protein n=1 Tax=Roseimaritima multifibrata TaxID=1930274 RepID=A0A517MMH0_9BACT|nr:hypothetical protein FF011L_48940 [Roseimaritima multifibrata]
MSFLPLTILSKALSEQVCKFRSLLFKMLCCPFTPVRPINPISASRFGSGALILEFLQYEL